MTRPPPLPSDPGPRTRRDEEEHVSNYFWTVTLFSLCLVGLLLLLLLLAIVQGVGGNNAGAGAGAGQVADAKGAGAEDSKTAGSGSADDSGETGSTPESAPALPEQAGNAADQNEPANTPAESASQNAAADTAMGSEGVSASTDSAAIAEPTAVAGQGTADREAGTGVPNKKNTISFAEPETETSPPPTEPTETQEKAETAKAPQAKGPELGLFSKPEASFFGVNVEAEKVAFVLDASSSMLGPTPETLRTKFDRLKEELLRSVKGLTPKQIFTVVMFSDIPLLHPSFHRVNPSPRKIDDLENILLNTFPLGGTEPTAAMAEVLKDDYDVIFLLSDGEFDPAAIDWIRRQNSRHIVICTICLGGDALTLQRIAKDSGGRYTSVK